MQRVAIYTLVLMAGFAALSWEVLWQLKISLAIGVSAMGTAITLATTMLGMSMGALVCGRFLKNRIVDYPLRIYAILELTIGFSGLLLLPGFRLLEQLDAYIYATQATLAPITQMIGLAALIGLPAIAMGATIPVFGLVAERYETSLSKLYATNTAGAAIGCLVVAFVLMPKLGIEYCIFGLSALNGLVALLSTLQPKSRSKGTEAQIDRAESASQRSMSKRHMECLVFATGLATFALEVAWFRSLRSSFQATSESFAVMLAAVLLGITIGARLAPWAQNRKIGLGNFLALGGLCIVASTWMLERLDVWVPMGFDFSQRFTYMLFASFFVVGIPIAILSVVLPYVLDQLEDPDEWARCYSLNTFGAIIGSLLSAWLLLPRLGFQHTSMLVAFSLIALALPALSRKFAGLTLALTVVVTGAVYLNPSGVGISRIQGRLPVNNYSILESRETPDSTVAVLQGDDGHRFLVIDGFVASGDVISAHYMEWMGRLPMILHPKPLDALVICFGTGQTAHYVRDELAEHIDLVDLNRAVLEMAHHFPINEDIIHDPKLRSIVMDGRAWLRRTSATYDVITLEPMPPNFAGVNSLYSEEFYALAKSRLKPGGIVTQWVPFHLLAPFHSTSIARTFQKVFPNSIMWIDPQAGHTGLLVGTTSESPLGTDWPGYQRPVKRDLSLEWSQNCLILERESLRRYGALGEVITDDNQLLNYGSEKLKEPIAHKLLEINLAVVHGATTYPPPNPLSPSALVRRLANPSPDRPPRAR